MNWHTELRGKFPALRSWTYVNTAAAGPIAYEVARAGCEVYESMLGGGDEHWEKHLSAQEQARQDLAALAGCEPTQLGFTRNTSHSAALAAQMLWEAGKRTVVALEDEFPASTIPFLNRGFDVRFVKSEGGRYPLARIEEALDGRDVLVSSHVMFRTGQTLDPAALGALASSKGAHFVLNTTQSLGALQVDFNRSGASFLIGTSHKWLCAGYGGAYLGMRPDLIGAYRWPIAGWISQKDPGQMRNDVLDLAKSVRVVEMGSSPFPVLLALGAAVRLWLDAGPERVEARVKSLTRALRSRLRDAGFDVPDRPEEELSGITVVPVPEAELACDRLRAQRIATTARGVGVRLGVHAFNNESDLDRAVEALAALG